MSLKIRILPRYHRVGLVSLGIVALLLSLAPIAEAGYKPPSRRSSPRPGSTVPGGVRGGCGGFMNPPLTLLAPVVHVGQTTATHPTVAWFVPNQESYPVEMSLFELNEQKRGKKIYSTTMQSRFGIMTATLPQNQTELTVGRKYLWQVALLCNPNRPSQDQWIEREMEVVPMPESLQTQLATTTDPLQRASLYAESGLWYDAIAEAAKVPDAKTFRVDLLKSLSQLETAEQKSRLAAIASLLEQQP